MRTSEQLKAAAVELQRQVGTLPDIDVFGESNIHERQQMFAWAELLISAARMIDFDAASYLEEKCRVPSKAVRAFIDGAPSDLDEYLSHDDGRDTIQYGL